MRHQIRIWAGALGLVGFGAALLIHIFSFAEIDVSSRIPFVWLMHVAVLSYFGCAVLLLRAEAGTALSFRLFQDHLPPWVLLAIALFLVYEIVNFVYCASLTGGGNADFVNGEYLLLSHNRVLTHLTESEYHLHKAYELQMFSGGWLFFWALASSYFLFWKRLPARSADRLLA